MNRPRTIEGRWWLFGELRRPHFGVLKYTPDTGLNLEVKIPESRTETTLLRDSARFPDIRDVIHGRDEHDRPLTLFGCHRERARNTSGLRTYGIDALRAILGESFGSWKEVQYRSTRVHFTSLHEWMANVHKYWKVTALQQPSSLNLAFSNPPDVTATLDDGTVISCVAEGSTSRGLDEHSFLSNHHISIHMPVPLGIQNLFDRYIFPIRKMLTLFIGYPVYVEDVVFPQEGSPPKSPHELLQANHGVEMAKRDAFFSLVPCAEVFDNLPMIIKRWFEYHSRLDSTLNLLFATIFNRSLYGNHQFLFLAQALETYHNDNPDFTSSVLSKADFRRKCGHILGGLSARDSSWLREQLHHANQKNLATRLKDILKKYPADVRQFIRHPLVFADRVRHTRNYYTHFDKELERKGKVAKGTELTMLIVQMRTLLEVCVLRDLGIGDKPVARAIQRIKGMEISSIE